MCIKVKEGIEMINQEKKADKYLFIVKQNRYNPPVVETKKLKEQNISTGIHYPVPLHLQPAYKYLGYKRGDFPEAEKASKEILSLPIYPELTEKQIKFIVNTIKNYKNG